MISENKIFEFEICAILHLYGAFCIMVMSSSGLDFAFNFNLWCFPQTPEFSVVFVYGFMTCVLICICIYVGFGDPLYVFRQWFSPVYERVSALTADHLSIYPLNTLDTYIIIWDNQSIYHEFMFSSSSSFQLTQCLM